MTLQANVNNSETLVSASCAFDKTEVCLKTHRALISLFVQDRVCNLGASECVCDRQRQRRIESPAPPIVGAVKP